MQRFLPISAHQLMYAHSNKSNKSHIIINRCEDTDEVRHPLLLKYRIWQGIEEHTIKIPHQSYMTSPRQTYHSCEKQKTAYIKWEQDKCPFASTIGLVSNFVQQSKLKKDKRSRVLERKSEIYICECYDHLRENLRLRREYWELIY